MQFGHLEKAEGTIAKIDWTDLKLSDFEKEDTVLTNYKVAFTGFYSDINRQYKPHHVHVASYKMYERCLIESAS